ncbi:MAG: glycosyltransferase [Candidatus Saccharibacteria bacterium]|nr:glycosyltransferase [Candidatus Saccharibacteria bacterium]
MLELPTGMQKIYIDVTQSYAWKGKATGIIRVMDEISSRFMLDETKDSLFVVWDEVDANFYEIDYPRALLARHSKPNKHEVEVTTLADSKLLRKVVLKLPLSRTVHAVLKKQRLKGAAAQQPVMFEQSSILFMPHGGTWESDKYAKKIISLKVEKNVRLAPILYDLCPVLTPQFCSEGIRKIFSSYMQKVLPEASLILAISKNTSDDAQAWIAATQSKKLTALKVFRLGDEIAGGNSVKPKGLGLPKEFVLCVGTIEARKNHTSLYYAYKLAEQRGVELPAVVIVGRKGWLAEDIYEIITNDPTVKDKFVFLHNTSDDELNWLYGNALFSVYPSFYEGWGLPIAESLLRGVPCVASNTSSMPEIAGDLVDYFSPYAPQEIMESIYSLSSNPSLLAQKASKLKQGYKVTHWDDTYMQVATLLEKLAN